MEKCSRCGGELFCVANNAKYCKKCRAEVDKELNEKRTDRLRMMKSTGILEVFSEWKINMSSLCDYLWLSHNGLYNKLNQWLDLTIEQKRKARDWFERKAKLIIKCIKKLERDLQEVRW